MEYDRMVTEILSSDMLHKKGAEGSSLVGYNTAEDAIKYMQDIASSIALKNGHSPDLAEALSLLYALGKDEVEEIIGEKIDDRLAEFLTELDNNNIEKILNPHSRAVYYGYEITKMMGLLTQKEITKLGGPSLTTMIEASIKPNEMGILVPGIIYKEVKATTQKRGIIMNYWNDIISQDGERIRSYFTDNAVINFHNTNEEFNLEEFITVNCDYPGTWTGEIQMLEQLDSTIITVIRVRNYDDEISFHVTSFAEFFGTKICRIDEYWGEDGEAPKWRREKKIGRPIK